MLKVSFRRRGTVNTKNIVSRSDQVKWQDTDVFGNEKCHLENSTTACPSSPRSWGVTPRKRSISFHNVPHVVSIPSVHHSMLIAFRSLFLYKQVLSLQEWCPMPPINLQYVWKWGTMGFWSPRVLVIVHHPAYSSSRHISCIAYAPSRGPETSLCFLFHMHSWIFIIYCKFIFFSVLKLTILNFPLKESRFVKCHKLPSLKCSE